MSTKNATRSTPGRRLRDARLRPEQLSEGFCSELGDVMAYRPMMMRVCSALVENARSGGIAAASEPWRRGRMIDPHPSAKELFESMGSPEGGVDVRIFMMHEGVVGNSFVVGTVLETNSGLKIRPYKTGRTNNIKAKFSFDDGVDDRTYMAESMDEAVSMWKADVPELKRSHDTKVSKAIVVLPSQDPSGPFLVEYDEGHRKFDTLFQLLDHLCLHKGQYKISDSGNQVILDEGSSPTTPTTKTINKQLILDARDRGGSVVHLEIAGRDAVVGTCPGKLSEGEIVSTQMPDGNAVIGKVVYSSASLAMVEARSIETEHIDVIRRAKQMNLTFSEGEVMKTYEPIGAPVINHRVVVVSESSVHDGKQGLIVKPSLDADGNPRGGGSKFDPLKESFVRLDDGTLIVIGNEKLSKV
jgi:hypothetical protein